MWDIEVEEDHSYVAHGFVNHNSCDDPNLQNIPEWMRAMFVPPPGYVYVAADYSALELWVNAIYSGAPNLLEALRSADVHRGTVRTCLVSSSSTCSRLRRPLAASRTSS